MWAVRRRRRWAGLGRRAVTPRPRRPARGGARRDSRRPRDGAGARGAHQESRRRQPVHSASGFSLGATITRPTAGTGRAPAVILVGGPGRQDRDETLYGVPIFGQIAGPLADAGYFVVRYDKRGVGQSGGRTENAGIAEYAEDVIAIVNWLRKRNDVDAERIAVVGHGEGAVVALTAAGRERRIRPLVLLEAPGKTGRELTLEQQQALLLRLNEPESERQAKIATQMQMIDAVVSGKGWDALPPELRRQADTPWFKSWLLFDPAVAITRVNQPVLIVHGALDTQIPPSHADRLEEMARARKRVAPEATRKVIVPASITCSCPRRPARSTSTSRWRCGRSRRR